MTAHRSPATPELSSTALETKTFSVAALLEAIRKGRVRVPHFQRRFRWEDEDRRLLFDSIQAGYPIGTLLLAQGAAPADKVVLGGFVAEVPPVDNALWVVDGQQRLATLAMGLLDESSEFHRPIYFDLQEGRFVLGARRRAPATTWVPTHVLASSALLNKWLRQQGLSEELSDRADAVASRIREYSVPAYLVPAAGDDDRVLREIFARVNRSKHALSSAEVFQALHSTRAGGKGLIDRVIEDVVQTGFGTLEAKQVERAAMAVAGLQPRGTLEEGLGKDADVPALFRRVSDALMRAAEFLLADAEVPHIAWLPYGGALAALARFFDLHPEPHPRTRVLLTRWFWRGILTGDHRTDNRIDGPKWEAIDSEQHESIRRLLSLLPQVTMEKLPQDLSPYVAHSAQTKMELVALNALGPLRLIGDAEERGTAVDTAVLLEEEKSGFPTVVFPSAGKRALANVLLHPRIDPEQHAALAVLPAEWLKTHAIDEAVCEALRTGDATAFLARRGALLLRHVQDFLVRKAGLDAVDKDRLALEAYFEEQD